MDHQHYAHARGGAMDRPEGWEQDAEQWLRWARTPGHDEYWQYRDSFFTSIVPVCR